MVSNRTTPVVETEQSPLRVCLKFLQEGHEPAAALEFVGDWGQGEIKQAFKQYARLLNQGRPLTVILEDIAEAYPSPETELLMASIQTRLQTGVFPASTHEVMTEAEGVERQVRDDMEFLVGPGHRWTLGLVWAGILGGAMLLIALPQYSNALLGSAVGRAVFCVAVVLEIVGFLWASALLRLQTEILSEMKRR